MRYPDYVKQFKLKGTIVKKVNGTYYAYYATSKRVPDKKYPDDDSGTREYDLKDLKLLKYNCSVTMGHNMAVEIEYYNVTQKIT